jgi:hypothetical protein
MRMLTAHEVQPAITVAALVRADERLREEVRTFDDRVRGSGGRTPRTTRTRFPRKERAATRFSRLLLDTHWRRGAS